MNTEDNKSKINKDDEEKKVKKIHEKVRCICLWNYVLLTLEANSVSGEIDSEITGNKLDMILNTYDDL